jgi:FMN-dependent NADH-azoreductase
MSNDAIKILKIDSSARFGQSQSRYLTNELVKKLTALYDHAIVKERDLYSNLPFLSDTMISSMFTPPNARTEQQTQSLRVSDEIANEVKEADILVLGVPVYNLSIPASLKAWIDMMVRAGLTFKYEANGRPVGLLKDLKTYVVITSGGVSLDSSMDFVSGYLRSILGFVGITNIQFIDATQILIKGEDLVMREAKQTIENITVGV